MAVPLVVCLAGCWSGTIGLVALIDQDDDGDNRVPTAITTITPTDGQVSRVVVEFLLQIEPGERARIEAVEFDLGDGGGFRNACLQPGFPADGVVGSELLGDDDPEAQTVRVTWNAAMDLDSLLADGSIGRPVTARCRVRITVRNLNEGRSVESTTGEFFLDQGLTATFAGGGAGDGDRASFAAMQDPLGIAVDLRGTVWVADTGNHRVRRIDRSGYALTATQIATFAGNGFAGIVPGTQPARATSLENPVGIAAMASGDFFIAEAAADGLTYLRFVEEASGLISTVDVSVGEATDLVLSARGFLYLSQAEGRVVRFDVREFDPIAGVPQTAEIDGLSEGMPTALAVDGSGESDRVYAADAAGLVVRSLIVDDAGAESNLRVEAGGGSNTNPSIGDSALDVQLQAPSGLAVQPGGGSPTMLLIADEMAPSVLVVEIGTNPNEVRNVFDATDSLTQPTGVAVDAVGTMFVVERGGGVQVDSPGHRVVAATNAMSDRLQPFAGDATARGLTTPLDDLLTQVTGVLLAQDGGFG